MSEYDGFKNSAGLNTLLKTYCGVENDKKDYISGLMNTDPEIWNRRPLSEEMIDYAAQDVIYLPWLMSQLG